MTTSNMLKNSFGWIGTMGPYLLNIISFLLLASKPLFLFFYILGMFINIMINFALKVWIQDPRPKEDIKLFELGVKHGKRSTFDQYGMPSGHSQSVGFSLAYILLALQNTHITLFYLSISLITLMQRFEYKNHTFPQIIVGFFLGLFLGYLCFQIAKKMTKGKINGKPDDNFFLQ